MLETYGELALGPYAGFEVGRAVNPEMTDIVGALRDILRESKTTTTNCGVAVPLSQSLVSVIELPKIDPKQLDRIVPLEARKYIPVPITEVTLDWSQIPYEEGVSFEKPKPKAEAKSSTDLPGIIGDSPTIAPPPQGAEKTAILLAAIHNEALNRYQDVIKKVGLSSSFYEIEAFSTIRAAVDKDPGMVMILDTGAATCKLYMVENGVVRDTHAINRG